MNIFFRDGKSIMMEKLIKWSLPILINISIVFLGSAQILDIEGSAKISEMPLATASAHPVGREVDGTLVQMVSGGSYSIGDFAHGGVVFWVNSAGDHGRVACLYNVADVIWSNIASSEIGASAQSNVFGAGNSVAIISQAGHTTSAAAQCLNLAFGGYDDWYLPAKDELNRMYIARTTIDSTSTANGGEAFQATGYWSSTESESDFTEAWNQNFFGSGTQQGDLKTGLFYVRAIRAF